MQTSWIVPKLEVSAGAAAAAFIRTERRASTAGDVKKCVYVLIPQIVEFWYERHSPFAIQHSFSPIWL